jgi:hypothetical protein
MKNHFILLLLLFFALTCAAQQIHTITAWRHNLEGDDTTKYKLSETVFDKNGKQIAEHVPGESFDTASYDDSGRIRYSNYIGGETDTYCTYEYLKNKNISRSRDIGGYSTNKIDSLDDEGRIIANYEESYHDVITIIQAVSCFFMTP